MGINKLFISMLLCGVSHLAMGQVDSTELQRNYDQSNARRDSMFAHLVLPETELDENQLQKVIDDQFTALKKETKKNLKLRMDIMHASPTSLEDDLFKNFMTEEQISQIVVSNILTERAQKSSIYFGGLNDFCDAYRDATIIIGDKHSISLEEWQVQNILVRNPSTPKRMFFEFHATDKMNQALKNLSSPDSVQKVLEAREISPYIVAESIDNVGEGFLMDAMPKSPGKPPLLAMLAKNKIEAIAVDAVTAQDPEEMSAIKKEMLKLSPLLKAEKDSASAASSAHINTYFEINSELDNLRQIEKWKNDLEKTNPGNVNLGAMISHMNYLAQKNDSLSACADSVELLIRKDDKTPQYHGPVETRMVELNNQLLHLDSVYTLETRNHIMADAFLENKLDTGQNIFLVGEAHAFHLSEEFTEKTIPQLIAEKTDQVVVKLSFLENAEMIPGIYGRLDDDGIMSYIAVIKPPILKK